MGRAVVLLLLVTGAVLVGWGVLSRTGGESEGLEALQEARHEARTARYLDVRTVSCCDRDGRRLSQRMQFAPGQYVYSLNGRITGWQERRVVYALKEARGCYQRRTTSGMVGVLEMRRGIVVPGGFVHEAELVESGGRTLVRWRSPPGERGYVSGTLRLDRSGRAVLKRERINPPSSHTAAPVTLWRYRYPSKNELDEPPRPRCKHSRAGA
jgi:hypothetical protein